MHHVHQIECACNYLLSHLFQIIAYKIFIGFVAVRETHDICKYRSNISGETVLKEYEYM